MHKSSHLPTSGNLNLSPAENLGQPAQPVARLAGTMCPLCGQPVPCDAAAETFTTGIRDRNWCRSLAAAGRTRNGRVGDFSASDAFSDCPPRGRCGPSGAGPVKDQISRDPSRPHPIPAVTSGGVLRCGFQAVSEMKHSAGTSQTLSGQATPPADRIRQAGRDKPRPHPAGAV